MNPEQTGKLIRSIRTEKGITQKQLAEQLNVSNAAVSKWETGHGFPDISLLEPLANALDITVTELVSGCRTEQNACGADPAKDILTLSRKKQKHSHIQTVSQFAFVILISLIGFALIVRIAPLRNIAPFLTSLQGSVALNLLAIGLGLAAWGCGLVGILYGRRLPNGQWRSYSIASFCLCSISLWIPLLLMTGYSHTEDIIMFLDTMGGYNFGAMTLLFISFVLNITSYIRNRNN
ncbi:MAG: helix-turn-helix domain-containing protein [Oscillospiraceae bacterium]|nr:helix-turn-helix domain-containing protein [Oscillospiraceae bacterium]